MTQQFLYRIQPTRPTMLTDGPTPQEREIVSAHFDYLSRLQDQGIVILAGRTLNTDETSFGIIVFNADSEEQAQHVVDNDPAVQNKVMQAQLFPYRVSLIAERNVK